jgi:taurine--2-oxoglutarate transaminase
VAAAAMQAGVYISPWYDTLVIAPPLIITEAQVDEALAVLDDCLEIADREAVDSGAPVCHSTEYGL